MLSSAVGREQHDARRALAAVILAAAVSFRNLSRSRFELPRPSAPLNDSLKPKNAKMTSALTLVSQSSRRAEVLGAMPGVDFIAGDGEIAEDQVVLRESAWMSVSRRPSNCIRSARALPMRAMWSPWFQLQGGVGTARSHLADEQHQDTYNYGLLPAWPKPWAKGGGLPHELTRRRHAGDWNVLA